MEIKNFKGICIIFIRCVALIATFSAAIVMGTSHQKANVFSISIEAKYSYSPALKYFVITNVLATLYGLVVSFIPPKNSFWRFVIVPDLVMVLLLTSSISAALAIGEVGKKGNPHAGWLPVCGLFHNYCHQVTGALAVGFGGIVLYLLLLSFSFYSLLYPLFV